MVDGTQNYWGKSMQKAIYAILLLGLSTPSFAGGKVEKEVVQHSYTADASVKPLEERQEPIIMAVKAIFANHVFAFSDLPVDATVSRMRLESNAENIDPVLASHIVKHCSTANATCKMVIKFKLGKCTTRSTQTHDRQNGASPCQATGVGLIALLK